jgi:homoserine kinase
MSVSCRLSLAGYNGRARGSLSLALRIMQQVTVRVPASTSNLGPGFDCLGVALRIYNEVTISRGRGKRLAPMARAASDAFFKRAPKSFPFSCVITGEIPQSRGLGSSAAIRLGVIIGLNEIAGRPLERREIFALCVGLEGHPDNVAPACYGGFNVVRGLEQQMFTVSAQLHFVLLVPDFEIATDRARALLPSRIDRLHAVQNSRNACAITAAFASREYRSLHGAFADHLHQPFRKKLIPFLDDVIAAAETAGALGGFLSGSGSTICAITRRSPDKIARAMLVASDSPRARTIITTADNRGARIIVSHVAAH